MQKPFQPRTRPSLGVLTAVSITNMIMSCDCTAHFTVLVDRSTDTREDISTIVFNFTASHGGLNLSDSDFRVLSVQKL